MKKAAMVLLITMIACISLSACSAPSKMELFTQTLDLLEEYFDVPRDMRSSEHQTSEKQDVINDNLVELGFEGEDNTVAIDQEFIKEYLEQNSEGNFLESIALIQQYCSNQEWILSDSYLRYLRRSSGGHRTTGGCTCQEINSIITDFLKVTDMYWISFDQNKKDSTGYYTENPNADPQPYSEKVDGKFYNSDGTNVSIEERTNETTIEYYRDFALATTSGYNYDEGRYGWTNGTFYDELPSWEHYTFCSLWYKGAELPVTHSKSNSITVENADKYKLFSREEDSTYYGVLETVDSLESTDYSDTSKTHTYYDIFWRAIK